MKPIKPMTPEEVAEKMRVERGTHHKRFEETACKRGTIGSWGKKK